MIDFVTVSTDDYITDVMPHTASLWAGTRSIDTYVADYRTLATSGYGKRRLRTVGLRIDGVLVASCKRYARGFRVADRVYTSVGIGAVFTPAPFRGRGYATAMLGAMLDAERAAGTDLAYLFSDIRPAFYAALGFEKLPSRAIVLRADSLPRERVPIATIDDITDIRGVFDALDERRPFGFARTPLDWEFVRMRAAIHAHADAPLLLGTRRGKSVSAYVAGRRVPSLDTFVLDEFAFRRPSDAAMIGPLLRAAAGDLRKITGWVPPDIARAELPRGAVRARKDAITMILPLSSAFRTSWTAIAATVNKAASDPVWSADHV